MLFCTFVFGGNKSILSNSKQLKNQEENKKKQKKNKLLQKTIRNMTSFQEWLYLHVPFFINFASF